VLWGFTLFTFLSRESSFISISIYQFLPHLRILIIDCRMQIRAYIMGCYCLFIHSSLYLMCRLVNDFCALVVVCFLRTKTQHSQLATRNWQALGVPQRVDELRTTTGGQPTRGNWNSSIESAHEGQINSSIESAHEGQINSSIESAHEGQINSSNGERPRGANYCSNGER
jgi:hypothetical protein